MDMISLYNIKKSWRDEERKGKNLGAGQLLSLQWAQGFREIGAWYHKCLHCLVGWEISSEYSSGRQRANYYQRGIVSLEVGGTEQKKISQHPNGIRNRCHPGKATSHLLLPTWKLIYFPSISQIPRHYNWAQKFKKKVIGKASSLLLNFFQKPHGGPLLVKRLHEDRRIKSTIVCVSRKLTG